jgi:hypothetical protein
MADYSDDGSTLAGAYGPRWAEQYTYLLDVLKEDTNTRQAVITIWRPNPQPSKDIPCTVMMHFMIRDFKLHLTTYMRSQDLWLGFPYDVHTFTTFQKAIAAELDVNTGTYHHILGSAHLYGNNYPDVAWAEKYAVSSLIFPEVEAHDLDLLCEAEETVRELTGSDINFHINSQPSSWQTMWHNLLIAYANKKHKIRDEFPQPFKDLREAAREVRAKFRDS